VVDAAVFYAIVGIPAEAIGLMGATVAAAGEATSAVAVKGIDANWFR
jgi:hypothetical protein